MDSLSFRNQQLAKRVELLQEELAVSEAKGKKGKVIMRGEIQGSAYTVLQRKQDVSSVQPVHVHNVNLIAKILLLGVIMNCANYSYGS